MSPLALAAILSVELAAIAAGSRAPETLSLRLEWLREGRMTTAEIHGRGVGIRDGKTQFRVSPEEVLALARALQAAGFGDMPAGFGEKVGRLRIRGKLLVRAGGESKTVVQVLTGTQSKELQELATRILTLAETGARTGVSAASLGDALARLGSGALAPETLELVVQRRPETTDPRDAPGEGFLLRVTGREAEARSFRQTGGYGEPVRLVLSGAELAKLIAAVRDAGLETLPKSLWAPQYTELRVSVLGHAADVSARRSLGLTAETHGERQKAFDRLYEAARALARRVLESGTPGS